MCVIVRKLERFENEMSNRTYCLEMGYLLFHKYSIVVEITNIYFRNSIDLYVSNNKITTGQQRIVFRAIIIANPATYLHIKVLFHVHP